MNRGAPILDAPVAGVPGRVASAELRQEAGLLSRRWAARGDLSPDPYDALASRWLRTPAAVPAVVRLGLVHLAKRTPVDLRPVLRVLPARNAYTTALLLSTDAAIARADGGPTPDDPVTERVVWLVDARVEGAWAYPFDVQTRTHFYPATTPNVICSVFAGHALLDAADRWPALAPTAVPAAVGAAVALVERFWRRSPHGPHFVYVPGDGDLIHNANVLAAAFVHRAARRADDPSLADAASRGLETSIAAVRLDGSLPYGEGAHLDWVDGHHTGFVVDALARLRGWVGHHRFEHDRALNALTKHYRRALFGPEGWPYQRPGRPFPLDIIAGAQGIQTFGRAGAAQDLAFAMRILVTTQAAMRKPDGSYRYLRHRWHRNNMTYCRWADASMALALATLAGGLPESGDTVP